MALNSTFGSSLQTTLTQLQISGLTPAISANDLRQRLSTFGNVQDVDGTGKLDEVGRLRKFAYVTLETTQPKFARCINLLSGWTWKGAKLRIGEAKPDYLARHEIGVSPPTPAPCPKLDPLARRRARLKFLLGASRLARGTQGRRSTCHSRHSLQTQDHLIRPTGMRREESEASEPEEQTPLPSTPAPVPEPKLPTTKAKTPPLVQPPILSQLVQLPTSSRPTDPALISLVQEKADTLALLGGMFGEGEWEGRESVSGDEGDVRDGMDVEGEEGYEIVPGDREKPVEKLQEESEDENLAEEEVDDAGDDAEVEVEVEMEEQDEAEERVENTAAQQNYNSLKDMFKPQEDAGGFSLGLDIELDPDTESFLPASIQPEPVPETVLQPTAPATIQNRAIQFTPDPKALFFFPGIGKQDVFSVISERGWEWPHPGTSEEIRAKWDKDKAELTREYTRRHREAVKRKRRSGGGRGDEV